jgi:hypothetical protein
MRKLKLEIAALKVESFSVAGASGQDGTVHGRVGQHLNPYATYDSNCVGGGGGATGPSNPVCIGPTFCCVTAYTTCCAPATDTCATEAYDLNCTAPEMCGL